MSVGHENLLLSSENLTKGLMQLPYNICQEFFKAKKDCRVIGGSMNLIIFENWLETKFKTYFNPLANSIAAQDIPPRYQNPNMNKNLKVTNILSESKNDDIKPAAADKEDSKNIKY